jgi:hypothetical protein
MFRQLIDDIDGLFSEWNPVRVFSVIETCKKEGNAFTCSSILCNMVNRGIFVALYVHENIILRFNQQFTAGIIHGK